MKPILLVIWPWHLEYPVFRWNLERFKDYFAGIWIGFSNHHVENCDLRNFIRTKLPFANFVDVKHETRPDWRDDAVNEVLDKIKTNEPICFMEQDFLIKDNAFFDKAFKDEADFIYYDEDGRKHPAFAVVKRELIEKTHRDFSACPPGDHFYTFFNELPNGINLESLGVKKREDFIHLAGLSQNYMNFKYDEPFYHPINFLAYNYLSLQFTHQHPLFYQIQLQIEKKFGHPKTHMYMDKFFPRKEE